MDGLNDGEERRAHPAFFFVLTFDDLWQASHPPSPISRVQVKQQYCNNGALTVCPSLGIRVFAYLVYLDDFLSRLGGDDVPPRERRHGHEYFLRVFFVCNVRVCRRAKDSSPLSLDFSLCLSVSHSLTHPLFYPVSFPSSPPPEKKSFDYGDTRRRTQSITSDTGVRRRGRPRRRWARARRSVK